VVDEALRVQRRIDPPSPDELTRQILRWNFVGGPSTALVSRETLLDVGGFDERLAIMADWDLWIRLAQAAQPVACPEVLVAFLKHSTNMQVVDVARIPGEFELLAAKHHQLSHQLAVEPDRRVLSRWIALGHLRAGRKATAARIFLDGAVRYRSPGNLVRAFGCVLGEPMMEQARNLIAREHVDAPVWLDSRPGA
jgi:GT2 family glycosyltransferase